MLSSYTKGCGKRLTLVAIHPAPSSQAVPLANAFIQGYLSSSAPAAEAVAIELADFFLNHGSTYCAEAIAAKRPAVVGFSMYLWNRMMCVAIARELRLALPGVIIFAGGPEATADPLKVLTESDFDFLICGEGEQTFAQVYVCLAAGKDVAGIPGVATLTETGVFLTPSLQIDCLDDIPSPWLNGVLDVSHYQGILWQLSRGCGFSCDFCFDSKNGHGVRHFSLARIEAELRLFASKSVNQIFVLDSTFNQDQRRAKAILHLIRKIAPQIHYHFEVRSEFLDREMAELFAGITCSLQIGLQSSDPQVLRRVGRSFNRQDFISRTMLLNETGAVFGFDLIYGLPGDTLNGFQKSLDFALRLYPNHLDIFPLAILPGTALAERTTLECLQHLPHPPYTVTGSPTFTPACLDTARKLAMACDIFYTRGRSVAWFNAVIKVLAVSSSQFLQQFGKWLEQQPKACADEAELSDKQIWQMQRAYLSRCFGTGKLRRLLPVVLDLADYHYHYAAALIMPMPQISAIKSIKGALLLEKSLSLSPSVRLASFSYDIQEILDFGAPDVRRLADCLKPCGSHAVIYSSSRGVHSESLTASQYRLLELMDGRTVVSAIIASLGITAGDAVNFLELAVAEGIILLPKSRNINEKSFPD